VVLEPRNDDCKPVNIYRVTALHDMRHDQGALTVPPPAVTPLIPAAAAAFALPQVLAAPC
jgi:hypothetical protein